jgi:hypothetical protein
VLAATACGNRTSAEIQPNRATTLYVPLPVFSEDMVSGFRQRAKLLGKKLKHSEIKLLIARL